MKNISELFPEQLYHSYIVEGNPDTGVSVLQKILQSRSDIGLSNPDMLTEEYESFTIADASRIKEWHSNKSITDKKRICIIGAKFMNHEAEQSLLKIIEEPQDNTHFFLVIPQASMLLGTLLSRTHVVTLPDDENVSFQKNAVLFMKSTMHERLEQIAELIERYKDTDTSGGLRFEATQILNEIEKKVYLSFKKNPKDTRIQFILNEIAQSRSYLHTPGASVKMILEHIALMLY